MSLIQKDVPPTTVDAMKRTISGMLGLLPSDQFQVLIEALWEPLSKLLVSSMMTGYVNTIYLILQVISCFTTFFSAVERETTPHSYYLVVVNTVVCFPLLMPVFGFFHINSPVISLVFVLFYSTDNQVMS